MKNTGAVVLAAGSSTRLGRLKQLLTFHGQTLVRRAVESAQQAGCSPVVVVLGANASEIGFELSKFSVALVENPRWRDGLGTSVRLGVAAARQHDQALAAVVVLTCDQPFLNAGVICSLLELRARENKPMAACAYDETIGVPAVFDREHFEALLHLKDEDGAKSVLLSALQDVSQLPWPEGAIDIDTPDDYAALLSRS
jgi:molybdenum cofactor cytidylyltransferase